MKPSKSKCSCITYHSFSRASAGGERVWTRCVWQWCGQGLRSNAHPHHTWTVSIISIYSINYLISVFDKCIHKCMLYVFQLMLIINENTVILLVRHKRTIPMFVPEPTWRLQKFTGWAASPSMLWCWGWWISLQGEAADYQIFTLPLRVFIFDWG